MLNIGELRSVGLWNDEEEFSNGTKQQQLACGFPRNLLVKICNDRCALFKIDIGRLAKDYGADSTELGEIFLKHFSPNYSAQYIYSTSSECWLKTCQVGGIQSINSRHRITLFRKSDIQYDSDNKFLHLALSKIFDKTLSHLPRGTQNLPKNLALSEKINFLIRFTALENIKNHCLYCSRDIETQNFQVNVFLKEKDEVEEIENKTPRNFNKDNLRELKKYAENIYNPCLATPYVAAGVLQKTLHMGDKCFNEAWVSLTGNKYTDTRPFCTLNSTSLSVILLYQKLAPLIENPPSDLQGRANAMRSLFLKGRVEIFQKRVDKELAKPRTEPGKMSDFLTESATYIICFH